MLTAGADGLEMEAHVRINPLPIELVTSFFTYGGANAIHPATR